MTDIQVVIFDMGGVLLRTEDKSQREHLAERQGLSVEQLYDLVFGSESAHRAEVGAIDERQHWEWIGSQLGLDPAELADFEQAWWGGDRIDDGLMQVLEGLRETIRTALLSNAWSGARAGVQRYYDFSRAFDLIVFSAEIGLRKPAAEAFWHVLEHFSARPEQAVFVDDFEHNITAARQLGIKTVHFRTREQALSDLSDLLGRPLA